MRSVAVASVRKLRLIDWCQHLRYCLLDNAVYYGWYSKLSYTAVILWDFHSSHRRRLVFAVSYAFEQFFPMFLQPRKRFVYGHSVYSARSLIGFHPPVGSVQIISVKHLFKQVCTVSFFCFLSFGTVRFCILFVFHTIPLQEATTPGVFCFHCTDLLQPFT